MAKWYFEVTGTALTTNWAIGLCNASFNKAAGAGLGSDANGFGFYPVSPPQGFYYNNVDLLDGTGTSPTVGADGNDAVFGIAWDSTAEQVWVRGPAMAAAGFTWNLSTTANPATGAGGISISGIGTPLFIAFNEMDSGGAAVLNTAGPFTYAVPSGFSSWDSGTGAVVPGAPTGLTLVSRTSSSITVSWTAPTTGTPSFTYSVQISTNGGTTWTTQMTTSGTQNVVLGGLAASTTYSIRVLASNSAGTGPASNTLVAATQAASQAVPGAPGTPSIGTVSSNSVALSWTAPTTGGAATQYTVQYTPSGGVPTNGATSNTTSATQSGLNPATAYSFGVFASNSAGAGPVSGRASATTLSASNKPRITAPLTGTVTTGAWVAQDITVPGVTLPSGKPVHFNYLLPAQYSTAFIYPVMVWLHPDYEADPWYLNQNTDPLQVEKDDADGFYNNVSFRTKYPAICVVGYADQTSGGADGNDAVENWGGWANNGTTGSGVNASGDTGPNVFGLIGVLNWVLANLSADPSRVYVNGFSLGGIGAEYLMRKYNQVNGLQKLFTAGLSTGGVLEINGVGAGPTSADATAMTNVPVWWVSGGQDTTSNPGDWNEPMWTLLAGNSNYPAPNSSEANSRAGSSLYHFWLDPNIGHQQTDASGNPYPTNTILLNWLFSQSSANTGKFSIANGKIYDPSGNLWRARGIDITDFGIKGAVSNLTTCAPLTTTFPGVNFVKLYAQSYWSSTSYESIINALTALKIVVCIVDEVAFASSNGTAGVATGSALTTETNWFIPLANLYASNPYVWFCTQNEPQTGPVTPEHVAVYNTIRGQGNNSIILLDLLGGGNPGTFGPSSGYYTAASYKSMTNVVWDLHFYGWVVGSNGVTQGSTNDTSQTDANNTVVAEASLQQQITSADGVIPVIIGEYGNSTDGTNIDANWQEVLVAAQNAPYSGCSAWCWSPGGSGDNLINGNEYGTSPNGGLTAYGQEVANWIASQA